MVCQLVYEEELEYVPPTEGTLHYKDQATTTPQCPYAEERRPLPPLRCRLEEGHDGAHRLDQA